MSTRPEGRIKRRSGIEGRTLRKLPGYCCAAVKGLTDSNGTGYCSRTRPDTAIPGEGGVNSQATDVAPATRFLLPDWLTGYGS